MTSPYLFTFIIAYRHRQDRISNLRRVLEWLSGFGGIEIIVVEQDRSSKLKTFAFKGIKHIFTESKMPFNKSWSFNVGLKNATSNIIVFGDCDLVMDPQKLIDALKLIDQYECVSPYSRVIDLLPNEANIPIDQLSLINRHGRGETDIQKICLCGGIIIFRKEAIYRIGGWEENSFYGWGGEDDYQSFKAKLLLNWYEQSATCYHLWHDRGIPDQALYQKNLQYLNKLVSLPIEDTKKYISVSLPKIGMKNKLQDR